MDLRQYVDNIHQQLAVAAEAGGDEARALAERLVAPLDAAVRLTLQDVLVAATEEITRELAPGSVELRLRGRDPEFVVTPPPTDLPLDDPAYDDHKAGRGRPGAPPLPTGDGDEAAMARVNLRMPDHLKARVEQAADSEGLSVNSWLVRAAAAALDRDGPVAEGRDALPWAPSTTRVGRASRPRPVRPLTRPPAAPAGRTASTDLKDRQPTLKETSMPTFDTPQPISVALELGVGDIRITASDRHDTVVEVHPSDAANKSDVAAAEQTRVDYAGGRLSIRGPKGWRKYSLRGGRESIDVEIALPAGSHVRGEAGVAVLRGAGRLGECRFKMGVGEVQLDQAGPVALETGAGDITVGRALDGADVTTGSGAVHLSSIEGNGVIKNSNGDTWVGEVTGDLRVNAANGKISVDHAHATVAAKTANGDVYIGEVESGAVLAQTACGKVEVGVRDGVAAWLELNTSFGNVHNDLEAAPRPGAGEDAVEVRARSSFGDVTVHRSLG